MLKRSLFSQIEAQGAAVSSSVEGIADGVVPLLSCSIPDLDGHNGVVDHHLFLLEVSANGRLGVLNAWSLSFGVSQQQRSLSDIGVAQHYNFKKVFLLDSVVVHLNYNYNSK